jgi:diguanylate cyclase (GGDEF)-like protein
MPKAPGAKRVTLVQKLILSYAVIAFFSIAAVALSIYGLQSLNTIVRDIVRNDFAFIKTAETLRESIQTQERNAAKYSVLKSPELKEIFDRRQKEFLSITDGLRKTGSGQIVYVLSQNYLEFSRRAQELFEGKTSDIRSLKAAADSVSASIENFYNFRQAILNAKLENADRERETTAKRTLLLSCAGFLFAMGVMVLFAVHISSSIKKLKRATHCIAEGDFDCDPLIPPGDEIGDLAQDFRKMGARLKVLEQMSLDASPLTRLPGNIAIERVLTKKLQAGETFAVCYADLDNFKAYSDRYGYIRGSDMIKMTGEVIYEAVQQHADEGAFVGHIGGDDFVMIVGSGDAENVSRAVIERFSERVPEFYTEEDRKKMCIEGEDRYGVKRVFPLMTISIAIVICQRGEYDSAVKIAKTAAEIKEYAKGTAGSNYFVDRRKKAR